MFFKHFSNNFCFDNLLFLPGDLADVVGGEGAGGEEVVAAAALEAADQLTHVRRVVVLRRAGRAQLRRPEKNGKCAYQRLRDCGSPRTTGGF